MAPDSNGDAERPAVLAGDDWTCSVFMVDSFLVHRHHLLSKICAYHYNSLAS